MPRHVRDDGSFPRKQPARRPAASRAIRPGNPLLSSSARAKGAARIERLQGAVPEPGQPSDAARESAAVNGALRRTDDAGLLPVRGTRQ
jgi:hypothetical protein